MTINHHLFFAKLIIGAAMLCFMLAPFMTANAQSRIKDLVNIEGVRDNQLIGYGLVVGLNGTGDDLNDSVFTQESLIGMLERLGINARNDNLDTNNIAAVTVTANLPPFTQTGDKIDITVSALGSASSLLGGTLLVTPLLGADGDVYAVAQGPISVEGYNVSGLSDENTKNVPTNARVLNGAIIEKQVDFEFEKMRVLNLSLRNPDFTTARRIKGAVNALLGFELAQVKDPGTIQIEVPLSYEEGIVGLMTDIENLRVDPDEVARVIIDEKSGVIVMGQNVRISNIAIAHGDLSVAVRENGSATNPFTNNDTNNNAEDTVEDLLTLDANEVNPAPEGEQKFGTFRSGVNLQDLVNGLNSLGVSPRDLITIIQTIKSAGALRAEVVLL